MRVVLNGNARQVPDALSVRALLDHVGLTEGPVAVEVNRQLVPRAEHGSRLLREGDELEVVHFVGGG